MRSDAIKMSFDFKNGETAYDDSGAAKIRVFAYSLKPEKGEYLFGNEFTKSESGKWVATFNSANTAKLACTAVMTVQLVDSDENLINSSNINLVIVESNSTTPFSPSQQFRDDCMDAKTQAQAAATAAQTALADGLKLYNKGIQEGNAIIADCNNAKTGAEAAQANAAQAETGAQQFKNAAETAANNAATSETLAAQSQQQADAAKTAAQTAQAAAEAAAVAAQNTDLGRFGLIKQDGGTLYIGASGGCFKNTTTAIGAIPARSMCLTLKFDKDFSVADWGTNTQVNIIGNINYASGLYSGVSLRMMGGGQFYLTGGKTTAGSVNLTLRSTFDKIFGSTTAKVIPAGIYAIVATVVVGETSTLSQVYVNGALKDTNTSTDLTTSLLNAGVGFDVCTVGNFHGTDFTNGCFSGGISRVMAFNFDMSATDAPYTIADYQSAKPIPPALCSTTATQRALVAFADYTIARNTTTRLVKDISANGNDATITGDVNGDKDLLISTFVDELKTQINQQA